MTSILNSQVIDALCGDCGCLAFQPTVSYAITTVGTQTLLTFTHSVTFDSGDSLLRVVGHAYDNNGVEAHCTISGAGSGATFSVTRSANVITAIGVTAGGTGYTAPPTITITGGGGTGAVAVANVNAAGVITSVTVVSGGTGYTTDPTIGAITTSGVINITNMNRTDGINILASVISTRGCKADFGVYNVLGAASGAMGNKNEQGDNVA